jgi:hypothetical protein
MTRTPSTPWAVLLLATASVAQQGPATQPNPWLPFRNPSRNYEPPQDLYGDLRIMHNLAEAASKDQVSYDEHGRQVIAVHEWQEARERIRSKVPNLGGYLGMVAWESASVEDRAIALYGMFFLDDVSKVFELIPLLPGEPIPKLRERGFVRAVEFLRVHWPQNGADGKPKYGLDWSPWIALLAIDNAGDQAQASWFLTQLAAIRPDTAERLFAEARPALKKLLAGRHAVVREHAQMLVQALDPQHRQPPPDGAGNDVRQRWLADVEYDLLPPIHVVSAGLVDLHPGPDRDRIVEVGRDLLQRDAIGVVSSGKRKDGGHYRGLRLARVPEPLDRLLLPLDAVITNVNAAPVASHEELLAAIEAGVRRGQILVEFVHGGASKVIEYRVRNHPR